MVITIRIVTESKSRVDEFLNYLKTKCSLHPEQDLVRLQNNFYGLITIGYCPFAFNSKRQFDFYFSLSYYSDYTIDYIKNHWNKFNRKGRIIKFYDSIRDFYKRDGEKWLEILSRYNNKGI